jgi:hypothetical protein
VLSRGGCLPVEVSRGICREQGNNSLLARLKIRVEAEIAGWQLGEAVGMELRARFADEECEDGFDVFLCRWC